MVIEIPKLRSQKLSISSTSLIIIQSTPKDFLLKVFATTLALPKISSIFAALYLIPSNQRDISNSYDKKIPQTLFCKGDVSISLKQTPPLLIQDHELDNSSHEVSAILRYKQLHFCSTLRHTLTLSWRCRNKPQTAYEDLTRLALVL